MPEISGKKVLGPLDYTGQADPHLDNYGVRAEKIGSRDTILSRLLPTAIAGQYSYDRNFNPAMSQNQQRFNNQGWLQWTGNNLWSLGKATAKSTVKGIGGATSLLASPFVMAAGYSFWDTFEKNPVNVFAESASKLLDEALPSPAFVSDSYNGGNFGQQLRDPGQLVTQNIESLGFLTSAILGSGLLSNLNAGSKLVSKFASGKSLQNVLNGGKAANLAGKAQKIDAILSHSILTTGEAAAEGEDAKKSIVSKLQDERKRGLNNYTDEQIDTEADQKATNVFWMNMAALSVTNIPFTNLYGKVFSKIAAKETDLALRLGKSGFEARKLAGVSKLIKGKEFLPTLLRETLVNTVAEGLEESIQKTIQDINSNTKGAVSLGQATKEFFSEKNLYDTTIGVFTDKERGKAAGLGALLGGGGAVIGSVMDRNRSKEYKAQQEEAVNQLNTRFDTVLNSNPYVKTLDKTIKVTKQDNPDGSVSYTKEDGANKEPITTADFNALKDEFNLDENGGEYTVKGTYQLTPEGDFVIDPTRFAALNATATVQAELADMMENETLFGNDKAKQTLIRQEQLTELARTAFNAGAGDLLLERFEATLSDQEGLKKYGATQEQINEDIKTIKDLANIYENVNKDLLATNKSNRRLNEIRKNRMFQLGARAATIERLTRESETEVGKLQNETLSNLKQEYQQEFSDFVNSSVELKNKENRIDVLFAEHAVAVANNHRLKIGMLEQEIGKTQDELDNLRKDLKKFDYFKANIRQTSAEKIVNESLKVRELKDAKREIEDVYDKYLTTKDLKKIADIEDTAFKTFSETTPSTININDTTSKPLFDAFVSRRAKKLLAKNKREFAEAEFTTALISAFVNQNAISITDTDTEDSILNKIDEVEKFINELKDSGTTISYDAAGELNSYLANFIGSIDSNMEVEDPYDDGFISLQAYADEKLNKPFEYTETELIEDPETAVVKELLSPARSIVLDFSENTEDYEDLASVNVEIKKLTNIIRLLGDNAEATDLLEELTNTVKPQVEKNVLNKELKNKAQNAAYGNSFISLTTNPVIKTILENHPDIDFKALEALQKLDPYTAYLTLVQALKATNKAEIEGVIDDMQDAIISEAEELIEGNVEDLIVRNPIKFVTLAIKKTTNVSPAITAFKEDYNIINLLKASAGDPFVEKLVNVFFRATALSDMSIALNSNIDSLQIVQRIHDIVKENDKPNGLPAPSVAQERVITNLAHFVSAPSKANPLPHDNIAALKSPPGAGKTLIIIPMLLKVLNIKLEEVITAAAKPLASTNLSKAVGTAKGFTSEELVNMFNDDSIPATTKVIVFDEASVSSPDELYGLAKAFTRYQRRNPDTNIKIIYLYDPNQGTGRVDGLSILDFRPYSIPTENNRVTAEKGESNISGEFYYSQNIYDIIPLPVSYRSDVPQVLSLQARFLSKTEIPSELEASTSIDPISDTTDILGTYVEKTNKLLIPTISKSIVQNPNRSRAIIVMTEADKSKYATLNVLTLTPSEAAGLTFDEVYVDAPIPGNLDSDKIRSFNTQVYTAISRAKQFAYLSGHQGSNSIDESIPEKVLVNSSFKTFRHKESIDEKQNQLDTINSIVTNTATPIAPATPIASATPVVPVIPTPVVAPVTAPSTVPTSSSFNERFRTDSAKLINGVFGESSTGNIIIEHDGKDGVFYFNPDSLDEVFSFIDSHQNVAVLLGVNRPKKGETSLIKGEVKIENGVIKLTKKMVLSWGQQPSSVQPVIEIEDTVTEIGIIDLVNEMEDPTEDHIQEVPTLVSTNPELGLSPNNEVIKQLLSEGKTELKLIKEESDTGTRYRLISLFPDAKYKVVGYDVAVLTPGQAINLMLGLGINPDSVTTVKDGKKVGMTVEYPLGDRVTQSVTLSIDPRSETIKYYYKPGTNAKVDSNLVSNYMDSLEKSGLTIANKDAVLADIDSHVALRYYTSLDQRRADFGERASNVPSGKPLLVIKGLITSAGNTMVPQFIELQTPPLDKSSEEFKRYGGNELLEFTNTLDKILLRLQSGWANDPLYSNYSKLAPGVPLIGKNGNKYYPFHAFIVSLANAVRNGETTLTVGPTSANEAYNRLNPDIALPPIDVSSFSDELVKNVLRLDELVHGTIEERTKADGSLRNRNHGGKAQVAMDRISSANMIIELPNMTTKILRTTRTKSADSGIDTYIGGITLLGPISYAMSETQARSRGNSRTGASYNPLFPTEVVDNIRKKLALNPNYGWAKAPAVKELLDGDEASSALYFTNEDFQNLFGGNNFENVNSGFGLNSPLYKPVFTAQSQIPFSEVTTDGVVVTNFNSVIPTNLGITYNGKSTFESTAPVIDEETTDVAEAKQTIREAVQNGQTPQLTSEQVTALEETGVTVEEAVDNYEANTIAEFRKTPNFVKLMKTVFNLESGSLRDALKNVLDNSPKALGSNLELAPRDFVASYVISKLTGGNSGTYNRSGKKADSVLKIVNKYYSSKAVRSAKVDADFANSVLEAAMTHGKSILDVQEEAKYLTEAINEIAKQIGSTTVIKTMSSPTDVLRFVRDIVLFSSEYRKATKETPVEFEEIGAITAHRNIIDEAVENKSSVEDLIKDMEDKLPSDDKVLNYVRDQYEQDEELDILDVQDRVQRLFPKFYKSEVQIEDLNPVSEEEGIKMFNRIFNPAGVSYISRIMRGKSGEVFRIISANQMIAQFGERAWGVYSKGVSYVVSKGKSVGGKVVLHEAFHQVVDKYLTKEEKAKLFSLAKTKYGNYDTNTLEEKLAEDFMNYNRKTKKFGSRLTSFFRKLLRFFNFTFHNLNSIEDFFESTLDGNFRIRHEHSGDTKFLEIERLFGTLEKFNIAKKVVLDRFESIESDLKSEKILSFDEILGEVFKEIREDVRNGEFDTTTEFALRPLFMGVQGLKQFGNYFFGNTPVFKSIQDANRQARMGYEIEKEEIALKLKDPSQFVDNKDNLDPDSEEFAVLRESLEEELEARDKQLTNLLAADISAETVDHELVDPEMKITGVVKQRLVSVKYRHKGREVRADFGKVYDSIINFLAGTDNSSIDALLASVKERTKAALTRTTGLPTNVRSAAAKFLEDQIQMYEALRETRPSNIVFRKDVNHENEYVIFSATKDVTNLTYTTAKNTPGVTIQFFQPGTNYSTFDGWVKTLPVEYNTALDAFNFYEQSNFIKSLVGAVTSLRRNRPTVGVKEYKEGVFKSKYISNREAGGKAVLETDLINGYIKLYLSKIKTKDKSGVFKPHVLTSLAEVKLDGNPDNWMVAKSVLLEFGIKGFKKDHASPSEVDAFLDKAKIALVSINKVDEEINPLDIISDESSFLEAATDLISTSGSIIQNSSYIRGDGKKAYLWVDSSWQTSMLTAIMNAAKGYSGTVQEYFSVAKLGALKSSSKFLETNIYFTGKSKIHGFFDHDSIKWKGRETNAKDLYSETPVEALARIFDLGFLSRIPGKKTYLQFLPIPSNRRTINAAEVDFLGSAEVRKGIMSIIEAQKNRPTPEGKLANNSNYVNNHKLFNLPGLDGINVDTLTTKEAYEKLMEYALGENGRAQQLVDKIKENLFRESKDPMRPNTAQLDMINLKLTYKKVTGKDFVTDESFRTNLKKLTNAKIQDKELRNPIAGISGVPTQENIVEFIKNRQDYVDSALLELAKEFYLNSLLHSYSLSQMIYGDETFFKSKEDVTKRIQVFTATGDVPLVDMNDGFPPKSRIGVMSDVETGLEGIESLRDDSFREAATESDGQGFMLPEAYERLAIARGKHTEDDITLKTVYAGINAEGIPTLLKYAVIVLTDELIGYNNGVPVNKVLHDLRENMRKPKDGGAPLDQAVFASAVKTGAPLNKNLADPKNTVFLADSIIEIDNRHFRFQLNPAAEVEKTVANMSQLNAMMNTNGQNLAEVARVHRLNANIMDMGMRIVTKTLGISRKGRLTKSSERVMREKQIQTNQGMSGKESLVTMLAAKRDDEYSVSLDLPIIGFQLISSLSSIISSKTAGFRFFGSKLVLQSEYGVQVPGADRLKYKDKDGFTEVMLPESFREFFAEGDMIVNDALVGFRIPTTNYHSAISLKVKGFYKVPTGSAGNIVITPAAMSYFSGHDYDIDSLFIIRKEKLSQDINLDEILERNGLKKINRKFLAGTIIGANEDIDMVNDVPMSEYLYQLVGVIDRRLATERNKGGLKIGTRLKEIEADLKQVANLATIASKNEIVHIFSKNIRDPKNRKDLLTPISFARVSRTKADIRKSFVESLDELKPLLIRSGLITNSEWESKLPELKEKGIDILEKEEMTPEATKLLNRYSTKNEDSVLEMYAKLEAEKLGMSTDLTSKQAAALVNPKGTLHDALTQLQIHSNTYSGVSLTGIAANTGKTLAYLFDAGRVTSITNGERTISFVNDQGEFEKELQTVGLKEAGFNSINELLNSFGEWKVASREMPKLKSAFRMGGTMFGNLSRFEKGFDGEYKKAFKFGDTFINIFETIDTIINLAIDNVKEQKLFVLGITNSNSNAFLAGVALGVPLNELSLLFRSPAVSKASQSSKFSAGESAASTLKTLSEMDSKEVSDMILEYYPNFVGNLNNLTVDSLKQLLKDLDVNLDYLKDSYQGKSNMVADYLLFREISKLQDLGQEMYDYANLFSILKKLPSDKESIDSAVEAGLKYQQLASEEITKDPESKEIPSRIDQVRMEVIQEKKQALMNSLEYRQANEEVQNRILSSIDDYSDLIEAEVKRRYESGLVSRLIAGSVKKKFDTKDNSVFENLTVFSLPHVYSAWLINKRNQYLIEDTFAIHSTELKNYADELADDLGITYNKKSLRKLVPEEFFKFVTSDMTVDLPFGVVDLKVNPALSTTVVSNNTSYTLHGQDAWAHKFATDFEKFKQYYGDIVGENEFLKSVEISTGSKGEKVLRITADKVSNPETLLAIKEGYSELLRLNTRAEGEVTIEPAKTALDLFKYSAISQGMFYSRTGFSLVFPISFSEAYSAQLGKHLSRILIKDEAGNVDAIQTRHNLNIIKDTFMYQLVKNNPAIVPSRKDTIVIDYYTSIQGDSRRIYQGNNEGIYFDLSCRGVTNPPRFISNYGKDVFILIASENNVDYYRKLASKHTLSLHEFPKDFANRKYFSLSKFSSPEVQGANIPKSLVSGNTIKYPFKYELLAKGDKAIIHDLNAATPTELEVVTITGVSRTEKGYDYTFTREKSLPLLETIPALEQKKLERVFTPTKNTQSVFEDSTLPLIGDTKGDVTLEFAKGEAHVASVLNNLPEGKFNVPKTILNDYYLVDSEAATNIARLIKERTGVIPDVLYSSFRETQTLGNLVSGEVSFNIDTDVDGFLIVNKNKANKKSFASIEENKIYFAGVSEGKNVYMYIRYLSPTVASIDLLTADLVSQFTEAIISPEEFDSVVKQQNC